jgi:hypothetical protein
MNTIHTSKNSSVTKFQKWGNVAQCQRVQKWSPAFQHYALAKVKVIEFIILNKVQHKLHDFIDSKVTMEKEKTSSYAQILEACAFTQDYKYVKQL